MMSSKALARTTGSLMSTCITGASFAAGLGTYNYVIFWVWLAIPFFMVYMAARDELKEQEQHRS